MWVLNCNSGPQGTRGRPRCLHGARASPCTAEDLVVLVVVVVVVFAVVSVCYCRDCCNSVSASAAAADVFVTLTDLLS